MLFIIGIEKKESEGVFIGHTGKGLVLTPSEGKKKKRFQVKGRAERIYCNNANESRGRKRIYANKQSVIEQKAITGRKSMPEKI